VAVAALALTVAVFFPEIALAVEVIFELIFEAVEFFEIAVSVGGGCRVSVSVAVVVGV
jgi:hypothetical protein